MTALIAVEWGLAGLPSWTPHRVAVVDIEVTATSIHGHTIIAIAGDAAELGILIEVVATSGVRDEAEEVLVA